VQRLADREHRRRRPHAGDPGPARKLVYFRDSVSLERAKKEEQSSKGIMWRDIGLGDWLFDFDREEDVARMPAAALAMAQDPAAAKAKAEKARQFVRGRFAESMGVLKNALARRG
jgi:hypothetical protein